MAFKLGRPNLVLFLAGLAVAAVLGPAFAVLATDREEMAEESAEWSFTEGEILESRVESSTSGSTGGQAEGGGTSTTTYHPHVEYAYQVEGVRYESQRITFGGFPGRRKAEAIVERFPEGAAVAVYYDPDEPEEATLIQGMAGEDNLGDYWWVAILIGGVMMIGSFDRS